MYINDKVIQPLEIELINNKIFEINDSLIINDLILDPSKITQNYFNLEEFNLKLVISKDEKNNYSVEIINLNEFGLILQISNEVNLILIIMN